MPVTQRQAKPTNSDAHLELYPAAYRTHIKHSFVCLATSKTHADLLSTSRGVPGRFSRALRTGRRHSEE